MMDDQKSEWTGYIYLLGKYKGFVFGSVVCLSVCKQYYTNSFERPGMTSYAVVLRGTMKN